MLDALAERVEQCCGRERGGRVPTLKSEVRVCSVAVPLGGGNLAMVPMPIGNG